MREHVTKACTSFCAALAEKHGLTWTQPVTEMVDMIMENPSHSNEVFQLAGNYIRQLAAK